MKRLDFVLPEWTRIIWNSQTIRNNWDPKIQKVLAAWREIEKQSVVRGHRFSHLLPVEPEKLSDYVSETLGGDLIWLPLAKEKKESNYSISGKPAGPGDPYTFRMVLTRTDLISQWRQAWQNQDDSKIGELLGYPTCCRDWSNAPAACWQKTAGPMADREGPRQQDANLLGRLPAPQTQIHWPQGVQEF